MSCIKPRIDRFDGQYRIFSNFYPSVVDVTFYNKVYEAATVEHAYQASKANVLSDFLEVLNAKTPHDAKRKGRRVHRREEWNEELSRKVMHQLVLQKFSRYGELKKFLLDTGEMILIEGNTWHDNFFGYCVCDNCADKLHQNFLGQILMQVRDSLK